MKLNRIGPSGRHLRLGALVCSVVAARPDPAVGQQAPASDPGSSWLPTEVYFEPTMAAPDEPRFSLSFISSDVLSRPAGSPGRPPLGLEGKQEFQAIAAFGGFLRLWRPAAWEGGGLVTGLQTGVFGRFLMSESANALMGTDWFVALPLEARRGDLSGRLKFMHRSAHLGDEVIEATGVIREDYTFEALDLVAGYDVHPGWRVYGGATWVVRSQLADAPDVPPGFSDQAEFQVGFDGAWLPWADGNSGLRWGADLQWDDRTDWRRLLTLNAGFEARRDQRSVRIGLIFLDGPSTVGQFFQNEEQFWGIEIRVNP